MVDQTNSQLNYSRVRCIVFGASGFIGRWVARHLYLHGAEVFLVVRNRTTACAIFSAYDIEGEIIEVDLSDFEATRKVIKEINPVIVFNLAGYGVDRSEREEKMAYKINGHLIQTICEAFEETRTQGWSGQNIVHVGSALEYGEAGGDLSEDSPPLPTTLYGKSKLLGTQNLTQYCRKHGLQGLTARLFTVYGPGEHQGRLLPSILETAKTRNPLPLTAGYQVRDFTYVEDVAEGLLRLGLANPRAGDIVNLATGRLISIRSFVKKAAMVLNIPHEYFQFGKLPTRKEEMNHEPVAIDRLRNLVGWIPNTRIEDGILKSNSISFDLTEENI